jgi:hypothetical protein
MFDHDISFNVQAPTRYSRTQVLLRLAIVLLLGLLQTRVAWIFGAFYLGLPIVAALSIQNQGPAGYPRMGGRSVLRVLHWWNAFLAFLLFASDRFPASTVDLGDVHFEVKSPGDVDFTGAVSRLLTSLPEFLVILLLGWLAGLVAVVAGVSVLLVERVPRFVQRFLGFYLSLQARWLVYHASLVNSHPLLDATRWQTR